ncbi:MAG: AAA family ATPase [Bacilli bacterium]
MNIIIKNVRISQFRSLKNIDVELDSINILIGQNNAGKSNFLTAIDIAFNGSKTISEEDIYIEDGEHLSKEKKSIIDLKICPFNDMKVGKAFSDFWTSVFTEKWITTDEINGNYVGIRSIIEYDIKKNDYVITRKQIMEWNDSIESTKVGKKQSFTLDMYDYINNYYMDAQRDVIRDIRDRKSYFGRATSKINLPDKELEILEEKLNEVNKEMIENIVAISETNEGLSRISKTLGSDNSNVKIEPMTRKLSDLHKGMDITFKEGDAASFSVTQHGMGTRSWISFLTLGAYVDFYHNSVKTEDKEADDFVLLSLEEPEAHLHPQAQRQIYQQLASFNGQKIISTHSTSVLAQAELENIIQFKRVKGETLARRFRKENYDNLEIAKIEREVINTHGELIFSSGIILCEGITEEQALPIYFKEFFGTEPVFFGINFIGIGGQNYKTYLKFIKEFDLKWYIFSDGEEATIKTVKKAIKIITDDNIESLSNIVIIENKFDYEKMLISRCDKENIIKAINLLNSSNYYENYINKLTQEKPKRVKTDKPKCENCGQDIFEDVLEEQIEGFGEDERKLYKCMISNDGKAKYAVPVAEEIVKNGTLKKRFPLEVLKLLVQIEIDLRIKRKDEYNDIKVI